MNRPTLPKGAWWKLTAVGAAVLFVAVALVIFVRPAGRVVTMEVEAGSASRAASERITEMALRVVDPAGAESTATVKCGGGRSAGTGYLKSINNRAPACVTVVINPIVRRYLRSGELVADKSRCRKPATEFVGNSASISGYYRYVGKVEPVERVLRVVNKCHENMWRQLLPLLSQQREPNAGTDIDESRLKWVKDTESRDRR